MGRAAQVGGFAVEYPANCESLNYRGLDMKTGLLVWLLAILALAGCKSSRPSPPPVVTAPADDRVPLSVIVKGNVRYSVIPWTEDLNVAKAILTAEYQGIRDPSNIIIRRQGDRLFVSPNRLMQGIVNPWLEPGDILELRTSEFVKAPYRAGQYTTLDLIPDATPISQQTQ
jgi:hypothetical protein